MRNILVCLLAAPLLVAALRFDLENGRTKCLGEFISKHDLAKGSYTVVGITEGSKSGVDVKINGPSEQAEFQQQDAASGKFGFTAAEGGNHKVCFTNNAGQMRSIDLSFAAGVDAKDYTDLAKKEHLKPLELALRKLEDRVENVHKELMFQRDREERHRDTNESTNSRVQWFSMLTITIVLSIAVMQVWYLYSFFKKRKFI